MHQVALGAPAGLTASDIVAALFVVACIIVSHHIMTSHVYSANVDAVSAELWLALAVLLLIAGGCLTVYTLRPWRLLSILQCRHLNT